MPPVTKTMLTLKLDMDDNSKIDKKKKEKFGDLVSVQKQNFSFQLTLSIAIDPLFHLDIWSPEVSQCRMEGVDQERCPAKSGPGDGEAASDCPRVRESVSTEGV